MRIVYALIAAVFVLLPMQKAFAMTDGEALNILATIDNNEIQEADLALQKSTNPQVTNYAKMIKRDHGMDLKAVNKLESKDNISPADTSTVKDLSSQGAQELASLQPLTGKSFDDSYIGDMVQGHTKALDLINHQLLGNVQNKDVQKRIYEARSRMNVHLDKAKKIQGSL